jgi:hypothetical protein
MTDFSKSVIYKICHKYDYANHKEYIGSTNNFRERKNRHYNNTINERSDNYNVPLYIYIRDSGGIHNWIFLKIEDFSCSSKKELKEREKYWIKLYDSKLNISTPNGTLKEWYHNNIERCRQTSRRFYHNNIEKERERSKIVYEKYKHLHAEKRNEREKQRYNENKKEYNAKRAEKIVCDICGSLSRLGDIAKHKRTKKCMSHNKNITNK